MDPREPPRLSIVVPAFNELPRIARCLDALAAQMRPDVELIVADDGSTDGTAAFAESRDPRPRVLRLPHRGGAAARASALREVRATRVAFLDADCVPCPGWMEAALGRGPDDEGVVMGRVVPEPRFLSRLLVLLEFGEFVSSAGRALENFAFLNAAGPTSLFRRFPLPDVPEGADRLLSWRMTRSGVVIRFDPAQAVVHAPRLDRASLAARHVAYARRFVAVRRLDPSLPGGWLARLGPPASIPLALFRLALDLGRLTQARSALGIPAPLWPAHALGIACARLADVALLAWFLGTRSPRRDPGAAPTGRGRADQRTEKSRSGRTTPTRKPRP